jgi:hypothetical protein
VIEMGMTCFNKMVMESVTLAHLSWGQGTFNMYTLEAHNLTQKTDTRGI